MLPFDPLAIDFNRPSQTFQDHRLSQLSQSAMRNDTSVISDFGANEVVWRRPNAKRDPRAGKWKPVFADPVVQLRNRIKPQPLDQFLAWARRKPVYHP